MNLCDKTGCVNEATHYNHLTKTCFCSICSMVINEMHEDEAMYIYGHPLCTPISENKTIKFTHRDNSHELVYHDIKRAKSVRAMLFVHGIKVKSNFL